MNKKYLYLSIILFPILFLTFTALSMNGSTANKGATTTSQISSITNSNTLSAENTLTPSATEGPYYPYDTKFDDIDNNLTVIGNNTSIAKGNLLDITGTLTDNSGDVLVGYTIELWHADASGIYNHQDDRNLLQRDSNFQNYGETITDENGKFMFLTILPGIYEGRMRHIHFKVVKNGASILTSQFLFDGDGLTSNDQVYRSMGSKKNNALYTYTVTTDENEISTLHISPKVVLNI